MTFRAIVIDQYDRAAIMARSVTGTAALKAAILGGNAARLFRLDRPEFAAAA